jgi:hypothetical protein
VRFGLATLAELKPIGILHVDGHHWVTIVGYHPNGPIIVDLKSASEWHRQQWTYRDVENRSTGVIVCVVEKDVVR